MGFGLLLLMTISMATAAGGQVINLYADWGHEEDALHPDNVTMLEVYYAFNVSGADPEDLDECDLYDAIGIIKQYRDYGVLVNYLICRDGTVICLAENDSKVWHAGKYNNMSLGIRIIALNATIAERLSVQEGREVSPGPNEKQYEVLAWLVAALKNGSYRNIVDIADYQDLKASQSITVPDSEIDWERVNNHLDRYSLQIWRPGQQASSMMRTSSLIF